MLTKELEALRKRLQALKRDLAAAASAEGTEEELLAVINEKMQMRDLAAERLERLRTGARGGGQFAYT